VFSVPLICSVTVITVQIKGTLNSRKQAFPVLDNIIPGILVT